MENQFKYFVSFNFVCNNNNNGYGNSEIDMSNKITYADIRYIQNQLLIQNPDFKQVCVMFFQELN